MSLYLLVPLLSCVVAAVIAGSILSRDPSDRPHQIAALVAAGVCFGAFCETLWQTQSDPATVLALARLSALGWVWIGPAAFHLMLEIRREPYPRLRRVPPILYGLMCRFPSIV